MDVLHIFLNDKNLILTNLLFDIVRVEYVIIKILEIKETAEIFFQAKYLTELGNSKDIYIMSV